MPDMKHHVIGGVVAAAFAAGGSGFAIHKAAQTPPLVVHTSAAKFRTGDWAGLSDAESAALAERLRAMTPKKISVFCAGQYCDSMAEDFSDVANDAGWPSGVERPTLDTNVGINVGPDTPEARELAQAIEASVNYRFSVGIIPGKLEDDRLGVVISRKPR